ncbi:hypothetical protein SAMN05421780_109142 [Flexibacter flexilis DSM 6793]|uniref:Uncharacterized protein n=1 Tax=Flexibacter flexilis DSM 6793 TaxID=927664 RepID=A0A1I1M547_9BACT|nr:hypothetical protein [Flexibacter flexilis]SFC76790.1 hypothetical protein SAMN05421780_109142 [Flexibacter flexilis DSM 6793]
MFLRFSLLTAAAFLACLPSAFSQKTINAAYGTKQVDGIVTDWSVPLNYYDSDAHLQYSVANDADWLYICARLNEATYQSKVIDGGLTLYLDTTGKKKQTIAIFCPISRGEMPPENFAEMQGQQPNGFDGGQRPDRQAAKGNNASEMMQKRLQQHLPRAFEHFKLQGFYFPDGMYANNSSENVHIAAQIDGSGSLNIEYAIRISSFYKPLASINPKQKLSLIFEIKGLEMPQGSQARNGGRAPQGGGDMGGGGPPMGGGEMGGGPPPMGEGGDMSTTNPITETTRTKVKFKLAGAQ